MLRLSIKLSLFLLAFFIFDKLFILIADQSAEAEVDKRLEMILNGRMSKDIIIAGSSRGSRDVIASRIEEILGLTTYNICYPGSDVTFHKFLIEALFKFNEIPKYIILVVDDNQELIPENTVMFRKDRLYPLIKYPLVWEKLAEVEGKEKLFSKILILNRLNKYNFDIRQKRFSPVDTLIKCGSMPVSWHREWDYPFIDDDSYAFEKESDVLVEAFETMIRMIKKSGTRLVVVVPPNYKPHSPGFEKRIKEICGSRVDFYLYDVNNPLYLEKSSFFDESHLMKSVAELFTDEIINYLRDGIDNKASN